MNIGIIGRTNALIRTAKKLARLGHEISFVWTCKTEKYYNVSESKFEDIAKKHNCPFINTLNFSEGLKTIDVDNVDVCISINFIKVIPEYFIDKFKYGILNAHAGDLPRYKGNACANWAILNDEKKIGLTIHKMVKELDSGDIYHKEFLELKNSTYITDIYTWLDMIIPKSFLKAVKKIENGFLPIPQDTSIKSLRCYPRRPEDSKITWASSARDILKLIRASSIPFDGAFCYLNNCFENKINIFRAEIYNIDYEFLAIPGQVCFKIDNSIIIATKDEHLKITDFSMNNKNLKDSAAIITKSLRNRLT